MTAVSVKSREAKQLSYHTSPTPLPIPILSRRGPSTTPSPLSRLLHLPLATSTSLIIASALCWKSQKMLMAYSKTALAYPPPTNQENQKNSSTHLTRPRLSNPPIAPERLPKFQFIIHVVHCSRVLPLCRRSRIEQRLLLQLRFQLVSASEFSKQVQGNSEGRHAGEFHALVYVGDGAGFDARSDSVLLIVPLRLHTKREDGVCVAVAGYFSALSASRV